MLTPLPALQPLSSDVLSSWAQEAAHHPTADLVACLQSLRFSCLPIQSWAHVAAPLLTAVPALQTVARPKEGVPERQHWDMLTTSFWWLKMLFSFCLKREDLVPWNQQPWYRRVGTSASLLCP